MEFVRLGSSELEVSRVGLGTNNFGARLDLAGTRAVVDAALAAGLTFVDTADVYPPRGGVKGASEEQLGAVLQGRRDRVVLATKFGLDMEGGNGPDDVPRGSPTYVRRAAEASLRRLRTDHVDLLYYHWPDGVTPIGETLDAMQELVDEGKARYLGICNVDAEQLEQAVRHGETTGRGRLVALQSHYSLLHREPEQALLPLCVEHGLGFVAYWPLANGLLTGKYRAGLPAPPGSRLEGRDDVLTDENFARVAALEGFASGHGRTLLELAVSALASRPGVASVLTGATSPEQVRSNAAAADRLLSAAELAALPPV